MPKRSRARGLALTWMLFALLSFPVAGWCQDEDEPESETETEADTAARHEREDAAEDAETAAAWEETYRGLYLQGQGSYGILATANDAEDAAEDVANLGEPTNTTTDDAWGAGGRLGWRVMKYLAIEGQFEIFGKYEFDHDSAVGEEQTNLRFLTGTLNLKGYLPINRFQPYVLVGGGYANAKIDPPNNKSDNRHGGAARFGVGADLYGNERVGVFTEAAYVLPFYDLADFDQVSIGFGLILRFYGD
jgi:hypothetical protein